MPLEAISKDGLCFVYSGNVESYTSKVEVQYEDSILSLLGCKRQNKKYILHIKIKTDTGEIIREKLQTRSYFDAVHILKHIQVVTLEDFAESETSEEFEESQTDDFIDAEEPLISSETKPVESIFEMVLPSETVDTSEKSLSNDVCEIPEFKKLSENMDDTDVASEMTDETSSEEEGPISTKSS